jgi:hypothetical protein
MMRPLGELMHRWDGNIKIGLEEIGSEGVAWILLAQNALNLMMRLWDL